MARAGTATERAQTAPHPDATGKPDSPRDIDEPGWTYTAKAAFAEFQRDQCTDLAAALTYYAVLSVFPALLALVSLLGLFGQGESTTTALLGLVVSGPAAQAIGDAVGLGEASVMAWKILKWPVMLGIVVVMVAVLYHSTPNVRQPRFRWVSVGAAVAIVVWVLASVAFGFYVGNFGSYNKTYGSLAGVIVFLLWLWITNLALLFGAEVDAELERARELQAGIEAEREIQLPPRDTRGSDKAEAKLEERVAEGRRIRLENGGSPDPDAGRRSGG